MQTQSRTKSLVDLGLTARNASDTHVSGLSVDSRDVKEGHLFFALPGLNVHGAEFIQYAIRMRAGAIVTDRDDFSLPAVVAAGEKLRLLNGTAVTMQGYQHAFCIDVPNLDLSRSRRCQQMLAVR